MDKVYYVEMNKLVNDGKATILKKSKKKNSHGIHRCLIVYNQTQYLLCSTCDYYIQLDKFTDIKNKTRFADKHTDCKECRSKTRLNEYYNDYTSHLHIRYKSIENTSKKYNVSYFTFEEFVYFAKTVREPIYNITLEEAFYKGISGEFEIEHKKPISKGGTSLLDNLFLSYKPFNRLKGTMSVEDAIEFAKLIIQHEDIIRKSYNL